MIPEWWMEGCESVSCTFEPSRLGGHIELPEGPIVVRLRDFRNEADCLEKKQLPAIDVALLHFPTLYERAKSEEEDDDEEEEDGGDEEPEESEDDRSEGYSE